MVNILLASYPHLPLAEIIKFMFLNYLALSMLQNGKLPRVFNEDMLHSLMNPDTLGPMQFLRRGMNALGLVEVHFLQSFLKLIC
jgi:hypothetical protein